MIIEVTGQLVIDPLTLGWCRLPYPNHPRGCPNWGKKDTCPPQTRLINHAFDLSRRHWFAVVGFNLSDHVRKMKARHPGWSDRQAACCLYWQAGQKRQLAAFCRRQMKKYPGTAFTFYPEAMGVDVFKTSAAFGLKLKRRPQKTVYKIAFIGYPLEPRPSPDLLCKRA